MSIKAETTFSLKDQLFNKQKVSLIAAEIEVVYPEFNKTAFVKTVCDQFSELELLERLNWIRDCLRNFLPDSYRDAVSILLQSLPEPCDPSLTDDDFGDFIYGPYGAFVAHYGCNAEDLEFSLSALKEMTTRFSVEGPIRSFINAFPEQTFEVLKLWTEDCHYHVRRLASEGTRPTLPWAKKITTSHRDPLPILDSLYADQTRYVTRSVANHLNDISKIDPDLVIKTLKRWQKEGKQTDSEMDFIVRHSLRTLEKKGYQPALTLLGYSAGELSLDSFKIHTKKVQVGSALEFSCSVTSSAKKEKKLLVDYRIFFTKARGDRSSKTFKLAKTTIKPGETLTFTKRQLLRPMTTRVLYPGKHEVELQVNGEVSPRKSFTLIT